ncbi:protein-L-isoaspartate O-methyltransferase [Pseudoxanthomonas broegbernensis]|uniref:Protein-L-isoaspartate O-methyltransferase n=1 Tax=Pseudoxanthomonas broegbernensis TaxID=83619 RepID=A0A7V8GNV4_9GAMM|nr:protein-L-isoaspartate O-methyltransferase [Pseudoxanthomonas broegbernensis]KAF1687257.1 protein-L-isoaspartate O-methyltransferase [Pseudoxanthomonas broegbernensis]MBB6065752.1 protein-L-isoaspartate(D-aspartate) O-methyltransferase [Pseudoxanthomonas broegbernensis]
MTIDYARARELMVEQQVRPWDVLDMAVLDTVGRLPREAFVPRAQRALAYADLELPLGHGARMMKPVVEGRMLQALKLEPGDSVLEVGTGSGYTAACLGALAREVVSIEIVPELAAAARARLDAARLGSNIRIEAADALQYTPSRQFDAVCVTAAVAQVPARFLEWLRPGGRLFVVRGRAPVMEAVLLRPAGEVNAAPAESLFETELDYLQGAEPTPRFLF